MPWAKGLQGSALYRLADEDQDGQVDSVDAVLKFAGEMGEHGPHAMALGPDGLLYILIGNFWHRSQASEPTSPYHDYYEGDLFTPRYEDAGGHAVGIKAPGGTDHSHRYVGYRRRAVRRRAAKPVRPGVRPRRRAVHLRFGHGVGRGHAVVSADAAESRHAGSEFGWRSGWSKWPNYYADSLAPAAELGRGSPAGIEVYNHMMYPTAITTRCSCATGLADASLAVRMKQYGATYKATAEVFVEGQPLNVTDIGVGPDGWLYFCTGGRDTEGGVYRIVWDGKVPRAAQSRQGSRRGIEQPQLASAWARQRMARGQRKGGRTMGTRAYRRGRKRKDAGRAASPGLDLMQLLDRVRPKRCWWSIAQRVTASCARNGRPDGTALRQGYASPAARNAGRLRSGRCKGAARHDAPRRPMPIDKLTGCWDRTIATSRGPPAARVRKFRRTKWEARASQEPGHGVHRRLGGAARRSTRPRPRSTRSWRSRELAENYMNRR